MTVPIGRLIRAESFDPEAIAMITSAFEGVLAELNLVDRADPLVEIVAKAVIRFAKEGERDTTRLRELVLEYLKR